MSIKLCAAFTGRIQNLEPKNTVGTPYLLSAIRKDEAESIAVMYYFKR